MDDVDSFCFLRRPRVNANRINEIDIMSEAPKFEIINLRNKKREKTIGIAHLLQCTV
jgi:hypothetical protein